MVADGYRSGGPSVAMASCVAALAEAGKTVDVDSSGHWLYRHAVAKGRY